MLNFHNYEWIISSTVFPADVKFPDQMQNANPQHIFCLNSYFYFICNTEAPFAFVTCKNCAKKMKNQRIAERPHEVNYQRRNKKGIIGINNLGVYVKIPRLMQHVTSKSHGYFSVHYFIVKKWRPGWCTTSAFHFTIHSLLFLLLKHRWNSADERALCVRNTCPRSPTPLFSLF